MSSLSDELAPLVEPWGGSFLKRISSLANCSAFLFHHMERVSWAGFYLREGDDFLLGPFQGKIACTRIPWGRGVCGAAAKEGKSVLVPDVHLFPGHIACDCASMSEIVIPLIQNGLVVGLLDIDSTEKGRFVPSDVPPLEKLADLLVSRLWG